MKDKVQIFEPKKPSEHDELCVRSAKWLKSIGASISFDDRFRPPTSELPDAIGWRDGVSILIEVKTSRSDFLADKNKWFRKDPSKGMGDWRFFMCPSDLIKIEDLPDGWGLLYCDGKRVKKVHGFPTNARWYASPFQGDKQEESRVLISALRRLEIRGRLNEVYEGIPIKCNSCEIEK